jgi:hypothetical protein
MSRSARQPGKLDALVVAIDAAAMLDPYPRLAQVMQRLAIQHAMQAQGRLPMAASERRIGSPVR